MANLIHLLDYLMEALYLLGLNTILTVDTTALDSATILMGVQTEATLF